QVLTVTDLKDCIFTIPLHPEESYHFAFSLPFINDALPMKHFQWAVLPQGMMNSPTICQTYMAAATQPVREKHNSCIPYHYTDDILTHAQQQDNNIQHWK
ncbi:POK19 protein, partial [Heliornis fulica]|nr:POK19 protein [Heliornis fulica]